MERFIRELRRGTKVRDHKFPKEEAVYKLLYLESERQAASRSEHLAGRWAERKLKGFSEVKEVLEKMLQERYAPVHRLLHITLDTTVYRASARSRQSLDRASARTPHLCCPLLGPRAQEGAEQAS